jgi:N-acetylmuramoyl-L-alanine amidase
MKFLTRLKDNILVWAVRNQKIPDYINPIMQITEDHWLESAARQPLAGGRAMNVRRFLIIHFTSGWSAQSSVDFWKTPEAKGASAHIIIDRDGSIIQTRPFNRTCGHAGKSQWRDPGTSITYHDLNHCSIGIELANAGDMTRSPDNYPKGMGDLTGKPIPRISARHKNGGPISQWETYPMAQLKALEAVSIAICDRYQMDDLIGHEDIAPDRKNDPGPAINLQVLRNACGFTGAIGK